MDSVMSATKHLLRALDESWALEDAELMQLIADAIDRIEKLGLDSDESRDFHSDLQTEKGTNADSFVQRIGGAEQSEHVREVTTQVIELFDPEFAGIYRKWTEDGNLRLLMDLSNELDNNSMNVLVDTARKLKIQSKVKTG